STNNCITESKPCGHASRSVNLNLVKKALKQGQEIGECTQCRKGHQIQLKDEECNPVLDSYEPVIWLCLYCGHQGCDRNTQEQHSLLHYRTPRSDPHCLILSTQAWNVWCYDCDSEVHQTSSKKLHEIVEYIKRQKDMAPRRSATTRPVVNSSHSCGPDSGSVTVAKGSLSSFDDNSKAAKNQRNVQASVLASLPKVKKPLDLILPEGGGLTLATAAFLKDMHSIGKNPTLNPGHLFGQICKKSTQFQGYEQQDAHELLRCLLEAIRNEEILRAKRAILRAFALSEKTDPNTVNPRLKTMIKGYGRQATHTLVDQIFGGHLISTVFCEECHWSSQVFEPMMDLSLPINEEKGKPKKLSQDEESVFDCFGRPTSNNSVSKHQLKKQKKAEKKQHRSTKRHSKGGSLAPSCMRANTEDNEEDLSKKSTLENERVKRRITEKSRPEDVEERARREEERKTVMGDTKEMQKRGESSKFKQLTAAKKAGIRGNLSDGEESDEDSEYDMEEDEEDESLVGKIDSGNENKKAASSNNLHEGKDSEETVKEKTDERKVERVIETRKDEYNEKGDNEIDEVESEDEDDSEDEETENESKVNNESDIASSKKKGSSTEISDADIEDNTDSERVRHKYHNTRQPSIVVEQSENETKTSNDGIVPNHRSDGDGGEVRPRLKTSIP
ncbi:Ubiquitin carboxyl-terminal hydrolase 16-like, partial [Homarus americanus]